MNKKLKYTSWIAGPLIGVSLFAGAHYLDKRIVDEKAIYRVVPEVKRVELLEEKLKDFGECKNIVDNSKRLSEQLISYSEEYKSLMEKDEVIDARRQLAVNERIDRYSSLLGFSGLLFFVGGLIFPKIIEEESKRLR